MKANLERVTAQWEGRVRRLENKLKQYEGEGDSNVSTCTGIILLT